MIKAVGFDLGHTLIYSRNPLSLQSLYLAALEAVFHEMNVIASPQHITVGENILTKYNTRINPREVEVSSDTIFAELFSAWNISYTQDSLRKAKKAFYSAFQTGSKPFDDAESTLQQLKAKGIKIGILTDVAYGMDNPYSYAEMEPVKQYFDIIFTSVDIGFHKPHPAGFQRLMHTLGVKPEEMLFVGDEPKDIAGANALGIPSVLIDRKGELKEFGQKHTIGSLSELLTLIG